jgi:hypothetical protein
MPVGEGMEVEYWPVLESTAQLDRNCDDKIRITFLLSRVQRSGVHRYMRMRTYSMPGQVNDFESHCCFFHEEV